MSVMFVIVPIALVVVLAAVVAYVWAARHGQFDDLTTPALRMLHDEPDPTPPTKEGSHVQRLADSPDAQSRSGDR
jgi:cbb3-type cytochrome oxidase maturation protein